MDEKYASQVSQPQLQRPHSHHSHHSHGDGGGIQMPSQTYGQQVQTHAPQQQGYMAQAPMNIDFRNAKNKPRDQQGQREFSHGLCSCCDQPAQCCIACLAPCYTYGAAEDRFSILEVTGRPDPKSGDGCNGSCIAYCLVSWLTGGISNCFFGCMQREKIRKRYGIKGGACSDFCVSCWCTCCALQQQERELELEEQAMLGKVQPQQPQKY